MKANTKEIKIFEVVKETEKAICAKLAVNWANGCNKVKDIWFPKSVAELIEVRNEKHILVADWMVKKIEAANSFKGYEMNFVDMF